MIDQKILDLLYSRKRYGIKPGLEMITAILAGLNNPERAYKVVHVAGTNGKGSVCAMLESVLREAGLKTGLYTSPHLINLNERIKVGGVDIVDGDLGDLIHDVEQVVERVEGDVGREATFFEITTAMSFEYFRRAGVDIAVIETGMGGRFDATNVVDPLVSVITGISIEHTEYLGKDIQSIAGEKCGIIKQGRPVVCGEMDRVALDIVRSTASQNGCILRSASENVNIQFKSRSLSGQKVVVESSEASYGTINLPLSGAHQLANMAVAITTIEVLADNGVDLPEKAVKKGLSHVVWPGRLQVLSVAPPVILDGAHNPDAAVVLAVALKQLTDGKPVGLVMGMCRDKDIQKYLKPLLPMVKKMWAVPIRDNRGFSVDELAVSISSYKLDVVKSSLVDAIKAAKQWAQREDGVVCITGSLFLVGETLEKLDEF